ncbi:MAG: nucleotidyltransferase domain-containing protein [Chloroflexi bacterium]|nr:nucleotidyltransferase domain-containing protein [Chloroflexota bacterium]
MSLRRDWCWGESVPLRKSILKQGNAVSDARGIKERIRRELPHLSQKEISALATIVGRLVEAYQPEQIYLFGSKARGDYGPDSDFDLLIVVCESAPDDRKRSRLAYQVLRGTGTAADVLVWTEERFKSRLHLAASLPATVVREGRLLHAA